MNKRGFGRFFSRFLVLLMALVLAVGLSLPVLAEEGSESAASSSSSSEESGGSSSDSGSSGSTSTSSSGAESGGQSSSASGSSTSQEGASSSGGESGTSSGSTSGTSSGSASSSTSGSTSSSASNSTSSTSGSASSGSASGTASASGSNSTSQSGSGSDSLMPGIAAFGALEEGASEGMTLMAAPSQIISACDALAFLVAYQQLPMGTNPYLPPTLTATVNGAMGQSVPVNWVTPVDFDPDIQGVYVFAASLADPSQYALVPGLTLPTITAVYGNATPVVNEAALREALADPAIPMIAILAPITFTGGGRAVNSKPFGHHYVGSGEPQTQRRICGSYF